jgi:hypothetical protein
MTARWHQGPPVLSAASVARPGWRLRTGWRKVATTGERPWTRGTGGHARVRQVATIALVFAAAVGVVAGTNATGALLTDSKSVAATLMTKRIFPAERTTSGFDVRDASSGSTVNRSSPFAVAGDGRTTATGAWAATFSATRYVQVDLNSPLPGGLAVSGASLSLGFASDSASGTACVYVEVHRISNDSLVATYGNAGSPAACVTGTTVTTVAVSLPIVASSDLANDLRIRLVGRDSAGSGSTLDLLTVSGATPYATFTLYPVRFTDATGATPVSVPWDLQGP